MEHLLNWIDVHEGDMIYVDAGTVHAIGGGAVIVETQQNSDTTYRLYDYGRPRELHIEDGLRATKEQTHAGRPLQGLAANGAWERANESCDLAMLHCRPFQDEAAMGVSAAATRQKQRMVSGRNARMRSDRK